MVKAIYTCPISCGKKWKPLDLHRPCSVVDPEKRLLMQKIENHLIREHAKQQLVERIIIKIGDDQSKRHRRFGIMTETTRCPVGNCKKEFPTKEDDFDSYVLGEKSNTVEPLANHLTLEHNKRQLAQNLIRYLDLEARWVSS